MTSKLQVNIALVRGAFAILLVLTLSGMASCGPRLMQNDISGMEYRHPDDHRLVQDDGLVDSLARELVAVVVAHGFADPRLSSSYGLQPWTGHTQNLFATLATNDGVFVYASIAKCCIEVTFFEMETGIGSNQYSASSDDRTHISSVQQTIDTLIRSRTSLGISR